MQRSCASFVMTGYLLSGSPHWLSRRKAMYDIMLWGMLFVACGHLLMDFLTEDK